MVDQQSLLPYEGFEAGYKGMYGGMGSRQIKSRKAVPQAENLLDRMDTTELAANQFRMTQAREKLARQGMQGQQKAIETHHQVGKEVREAIRRIGGTMPENLPAAEHIYPSRDRKGAMRLHRRITGKLLATAKDGPDAKGLQKR